MDSPDSPPEPDPRRAPIHRGHRVGTFRAAPWLPGPHLQTLGGKFLRPTPDPGLVRERWTTPDGDFVDLDFAPASAPPVADADGPGAADADGSDTANVDAPDTADVDAPGSPPARDRQHAPMVLILHGLEGSTARGYVRVLMTELARRGMRPVGLNFRSCSGEPNRRARFYHSGDTDDLRWVLLRLAERFPHRALGAVGFSLGGNVLLRFLGRIGAGDETVPEGLVQAAAAISVPFDLSAGTRALEEGPMGRLYTRYFLRSLMDKARHKEAQLRPLIDWERLERSRTLREFDDAATAPLHGFEDAWEYYRLSSSGPWLSAIRTPTLLVHAEDDPFMPPGSSPRTVVRNNPYLLGAFPERGGHVGFVEGPGPWAPRFWAESEVARYLGRLLSSAP